jgi:hypothetical protein
MAASRTDLESSLFGDESFADKAERFCLDGNSMVAYITKERNLRQDDDDDLADGQKDGIDMGEFKGAEFLKVTCAETCLY